MIRVATLADAPALGKLAAQTLMRTRDFIPAEIDVDGEPLLPDLAARMADPTFVFVCEDDLSALGMLIVNKPAKTIHIKYLMPETISLATGRALLKALLIEARVRFPISQAQLATWEADLYVGKDFASELTNVQAYITFYSLTVTDMGTHLYITCPLEQLITRSGA